ncbi:MAG TPA: hypothetical protein VHE80_09045, partial [Acidimicrobiales bacterium]|nr:hypothetical protein [Acidimicrobiales bacterium]
MRFFDAVWTDGGLANFRGAVATAASAGAEVAPGAIAGAVSAAVADELARLPSERAKAVVGSVRQEVTTAVGAFRGAEFPASAAVGDALSGAIADWYPNEVTFSSYDIGGGVSAHRDSERYVGYVVTLTLSGAAQFDLLASRHGAVIRT